MHAGPRRVRPTSSHMNYTPRNGRHPRPVIFSGKQQSEPSVICSVFGAFLYFTRSRASAARNRSCSFSGVFLQPPPRCDWLFGPPQFPNPSAHSKGLQPIFEFFPSPLKTLHARKDMAAVCAQSIPDASCEWPHRPKRRSPFLPPLSTIRAAGGRVDKIP